MRFRLLSLLLPCIAAAQIAVTTPAAWRTAVADGVTVSPLENGAAQLTFSPLERATVRLAVPPEARDFTRARTLTFEFESSSTIYFRLALINREGKRFEYRINPWAKVPARAAIRGEYLTREFLNNQSHQGYMISNWANHIDLSSVESIELFMAPDQPVTLRFGPMLLHDTAVPPAALTKGPLVDEFGQWMLESWPGKPASLADLTALWRAEEKQAARLPDFQWTRFGGWKAAPREKPTGFFRSVKRAGRWWLVDPEGALFFSLGMDCVRPAEPTPVAGREFLFQSLPPADPAARGRGFADFYLANVKRRYPDNWEQRWKSAQEMRLASWGFNTIGNWSHPLMFAPPRLAYVANAEPRSRGRNWVGFPDVFAADYQGSIEAAVRSQVTSLAKDPYLIGWFIGNEPRWHDRNLVERILSDTAPSATQKFCREFLDKSGDSPKSREDLLEALARAYYKSALQAIRRFDTNHMVLGIRYAGSLPDPVLRANDVFDMFSINIYRFEPEPAILDRIARALDKPILIGEFHFGAAGRGMAPSLVMVKDQEQRGVAYQRYVESAAAHPNVVGAHWFQLIDQAATGRYDGELYNLGFVNQQDLPYAEMVAHSRAVARRIYQVHAGQVPPSEQRATVR